MLKYLFVFTVLLFFILPANAQNYCEVQNSFLTPSFPQSIDTFTVYTDTVTNFYGDEFKVKLKFARPVNDLLPFEKRPLIISLHGGGFVSDSLGSPFSTTAYLDAAEQMRTTVAPLGYIGASLDYRTGYGIVEEASVGLNISNPGSAACSLLTPHVIEAVGGAVYRATTDCRSALDYIFRHPEEFPYIDTSQIYLFGGSAGAITALHTVFSETDEFFYPDPDSTLEPLAPKHKLAGIISYAGALADNNNGVSLNHMDADESVPLFLGHGTADEVVLPGDGPICNCSNLPLQYYMHGSRSIAQKACELNIPHELFLIEGEGHGLDGTTPVSGNVVLEILLFIKNWGICPDTLTSVHNTYNQQGALLHTEVCQTEGMESSNENTLFVLPNPSSDYIQLYENNLKIKSVLITDISGRVIYDGIYNSSLDVRGFVNGIYFITVKTGSQVFKTSFIKN